MEDYGSVIHYLKVVCLNPPCILKSGSLYILFNINLFVIRDFFFYFVPCGFHTPFRTDSSKVNLYFEFFPSFLPWYVYKLIPLPSYTSTPGTILISLPKLSLILFTFSYVTSLLKKFLKMRFVFVFYLEGPHIYHPHLWITIFYLLLS